MTPTRTTLTGAAALALLVALAGCTVPGVGAPNDATDCDGPAGEYDDCDDTDTDPDAHTDTDTRFRGTEDDFSPTASGGGGG